MRHWGHTKLICCCSGELGWEVGSVGRGKKLVNINVTMNVNLFNFTLFGWETCTLLPLRTKTLSQVKGKWHLANVICFLNGCFREYFLTLKKNGVDRAPSNNKLIWYGLIMVVCGNLWVNHFWAEFKAGHMANHFLMTIAKGSRKWWLTISSDMQLWPRSIVQWNLLMWTFFGTSILSFVERLSSFWGYYIQSLYTIVYI